MRCAKGVRLGLCIALVAMLGACGMGSSSNSNSTSNASPTNGFILGQSRLGIDRLGPPQAASGEGSGESSEDSEETVESSQR